MTDQFDEDERRWAAVPPYTWLPMDQYVEGRHAVFWFPHGDRGLGGFEAASTYLETVAWDGLKEIKGWKGGWTLGGPNAGSDWDFDEPPTLFMKLMEPA